MSGQSINVASVFLGMPVGGAEDLALAIANELSAREITTHFVCLRSLDVLGEEISSAGRPITLLPVAESKRFSPAGLHCLSRWLTENKIDIVHSHTYHSHTYAVPAAQRVGIPALLHHHKTLEKMKWHRWWTMRSLTRKAARVLALSQKTADDLRSSFRLAPEKVCALPNAVSDSVFFPAGPGEKAPLRKTLSLDPEAFLFVTVASLQEVKNHDLILRAIHCAQQTGSAALDKSQFYFLGAGPQETILRAHSAALGKPPAVFLPGSRRPIAPWLQCADAFLLPSKWEGQSLALLQAIRCGLPVLASRIEGNTAILGKDHPGLFEPDNAAALASLLQKCATDAGFRNAVLEFQSALPLPSWTGLVNQVEAIYRSLPRRAWA